MYSTSDHHLTLSAPHGFKQYLGAFGMLHVTYFLFLIFRPASAKAEVICPCVYPPLYLYFSSPIMFLYKLFFCDLKGMLCAQRVQIRANQDLQFLKLIFLLQVYKINIKITLAQIDTDKHIAYLCY